MPPGTRNEQELSDILDEEGRNYAYDHKLDYPPRDSGPVQIRLDGLKREVVEGSEGTTPFPRRAEHVDHDISFIVTQCKTMTIDFYVTNYATKVEDPV